MSERLTDEELKAIERKAQAATDGIELYLKWDGSIVECGVGGKYAPSEHDVELFTHAKAYIVELIAELRERRAQDLTDQEIEAIRYLRFFVDELHDQDGFEQEHYALADVGRAVLDKLLARRAP